MAHGEGFDHLPVRGAAAFPAEVGADGGFGHVCADVGAGVAGNVDLGGVVIAPESGVLGAERTVAVVHIIGLARDRDAHRAAVASAAMPHQQSVHPAIPVRVGIQP